MKEEKMMILSMLEEGKITSEEAIKLLEALEEAEAFKEDINFTKEDSKNDFNEENQHKPKFNGLENIGTDIGNALSNMFNGLNIGLGGSFNFLGNNETVTTDLDMDLSNMENPSLDLKAINGNIRVRPTDNHKLLIKSTCQYKNGLISSNEPYFDFYMEDDKIIFSPRYTNGLSVKLDVSLPEKQYNDILLNSTNGKIDIEEVNSNILRCITTNSSIDVVDVNSTEIDLTTKNGRIECRDANAITLNAATTNSSIFLMDVTSKEINAKTANSKITLNDIDAETVICKTSNSSIETEDVSCDIIHLITSNGKLNCNSIDMDRAKEIKLITSNGSISTELDEFDREIYFDLDTSMGSISLDFPNLIYKVNKQVNLGVKKIVAHTVNFNEENDHLKFIASTSNGSIKIYE